jgi:Sel1 repeat
MDRGYLLITLFITLLMALGAALLWGSMHAIYLNRIGSRGWASTKRLLKKCGWVFLISLPLALIVKDGPTIWAVIGARLGNRNAQHQLALHYLSGVGAFNQNHTQARIWMLKAAELGQPDAQFELAEMLRDGQGGEKNLPEALRWAAASAEQNQPFGIVVEAQMLASTDAAKSETLFQRAIPLFESRASEGSADAAFSLALLHRNGQGLRADPIESLKWMLIAANFGLNPVQSFSFEQAIQSLSMDQKQEAKRRADDWLLAHQNAHS